MDFKKNSSIAKYSFWFCIAIQVILGIIYYVDKKLTQNLLHDVINWGSVIGISFSAYLWWSYAKKAKQKQ